MLVINITRRGLAFKAHVENDGVSLGTANATSIHGAAFAAAKLIEDQVKSDATP